jgi:hypothetical protein|tara:strand:- start:14435 stop:14608 length:174 start_codon:yes stop_codon:yes gene_type:complete
MKVLSEHNWGVFLKSSPLQEMSTSNVGMIYKINEIDVDSVVKEYNAMLDTYTEKPEE